MSTKESGTGKSRVPEQVASHLATAFIYLDALDRRTFAGVEPPLTSAQYHALAALAASPGQSLNELAARLLCDKANASGLIDRLTLGGLANRDRDPVDGRRVVLSLTVDGMRALKAARHARSEALAHALADVVDVSPDLERVINALRRAVEHDPSNARQVTDVTDGS